MSCCTCYAKPCSTTPPKSKCPTGNCLYIPHLLLGSESSVGPCNESALVPFEGMGFNTTLCGETPPVFTLLSHSDIFKNVIINDNHVQFQTTQEKSTAPFGKIEYAVTCGKYSTTSTITIILKNRCKSIVCSPGFKCNPCDGTCDPLPGALGVEGGIGNSLGGLTII